MKVLIVKTSSMGDVIHTFPAVEDASLHRPDVSFDWCVEEAFAGIVALHPAIGRIHTVAIRRWRKALFKGAPGAKRPRCAAPCAHAATTWSSMRRAC